MVGLHVLLPHETWPLVKCVSVYGLNVPRIVPFISTMGPVTDGVVSFVLYSMLLSREAIYCFISLFNFLPHFLVYIPSYLIAMIKPFAQSFSSVSPD
jgi:hypothetical protein